MRRILKFPLTQVSTLLPIVHYADVLHVGEQDGVVTLWAVVDLENPPSHLGTFTLVRTGAAMPLATHVGTALLETTGEVLHVFMGEL